MQIRHALCFSLGLLIAPPCAHQACATVLTATFRDATGDTTGTNTDISRLELRFSTLNGAYALIFTSTDAKPFTGSFRINVNLFNPDAPPGSQFFNDVINDHPVGVDCLPPGFPFRFRDGDRTYILTGHSPQLKFWQAGHRVAASDAPYGTPPGTSGFGTSVGSDLIDPATSADRLSAVTDPVLNLGQGGLSGSYYSGGALFQWLFVNNVTFATPALVDQPLFNQGSVSFDRSFQFTKTDGTVEELDVSAKGANRGGALGASSSFSLRRGRPALVQARACGAVVHRLQGFQDFWDGVAYLFLTIKVTGRNSSNGGANAAGQIVLGTNPFDLRTFSFSGAEVNTSLRVPFGKIQAFQPFNTIFAVTAATSVENRSGQSPNASATADFLNTLTLEEVRLTLDPEGNQIIPVDLFTSDTGLVLRVQNGVGVPLVGERTAIDIKPDSPANVVNLKSQGVLPVAILGTATFQPHRDAELSSLKFGATGTEVSLRSCGGAEDVNGDALPDLVCHFNTDKLGLAQQTRQLILTGRTLGGVDFYAADAVQIVPR